MVSFMDLFLSYVYLLYTYMQNLQFDKVLIGIKVLVEYNLIIL